LGLERIGKKVTVIYFKEASQNSPGVVEENYKKHSVRELPLEPACLVEM
jgi:hypothetical protein